jgi:FMN reductase [NAD(P)H]
MSLHSMPDRHTTAGANETVDLLNTRASIRTFSDRKIEPDVLDAILEAGVHCPTGGMQPYSVIKIEDPETKRKIFELDGGQQKQIADAPVDLVFCVDMRRNRRWAEIEVAPFTATSSFEEWWIAFQDTCIFMHTVCIAAEAMGLGTVYIGTVYWYFGKLRRLLEIPEGVFPVVLLCMGYPKGERPSPRKKLPPRVVVHDEKYSDMPDWEIIEAMDAKHGDRIRITDQRIDGIRKVATAVHGNVFAEKCLAKIRENGYISMVQYLYGLAYVADEGVRNNERCLAELREAGFDWFDPYEFSGD